MAGAPVSSGYAAAERGAVEDAVPSEGRTELDRAWACAAEALVASSARELFAVLETVASGASQSTRAETALPRALVCAHVATTAAVTFDAALAQAVEDQIEGDAFGEEELVACARTAARGWIAWMRGWAVDDTTLALAEKVARSGALTTLLVQIGVLRALAAEARGDCAAMLSTARRVSRMASADGVARAECLAHLVLARARRTTHHPHLAIRILAALASVSPWELEGWIALEATLSGELTPLASRRGDGPSARVARHVSLLLESARAGRRADFERSVDAALSEATSVIAIERELALLCAAIDVERVLPDGLVAWAEGAAVLAPPAAHGLCVRALDESEDVGEAVVLAVPGVPARRLLGLGAALALGPDVLSYRRSRMRQGRVETLLAVLASAGPEGLEDARVFAETYEIPYQPTVHRGVFDVLLTRTRAAAEGFGDLARRQGRIVLTLSRAVLLPDPRASARAHDRLLRALARSGRASADEVAKQTGLTVRAAQDALKRLMEDGACVADRHGRQLVYAVEDTTFSEATELLARRRGGAI